MPIKHAALKQMRKDRKRRQRAQSAKVASSRAVRPGLAGPDCRGSAPASPAS